MYYFVPRDDQILPRSGADHSRTCRRISRARNADLKFILENLDKLVVKAANESGGYGMLMGPKASQGGNRRIPQTHQGRSAQLHRAAHDLAFVSSHVRRRRFRRAPHRSAAVYSLRRENCDCARRPDARRAAERFAGRELLPRRRQQRYLGVVWRRMIIIFDLRFMICEFEEEREMAWLQAARAVNHQPLIINHKCYPASPTRSTGCRATSSARKTSRASWM